MSRLDKCVAMLEEYDRLKAQLRTLEPELRRSVAEYGREELGLYGYHPDMLRKRKDVKNMLGGG